MTAVAPEVTVVICTRNRLDWLRESVASVLAQDGVTFELVVVDDGSGDGTRMWLEATTDPRLRWSSMAVRSGQAAASNRGLAEARGELIMFLDDDDVLHPRALAVLAAALRDHPEAVAAVGARRSWVTQESYVRRDSHPRRSRRRDVLDELIFGWSTVSGQNLHRTDLVRRVGGWDGRWWPCDDRDLWLRLAALGPVVLRPETTVTYRIHPGQTRPPELRRVREAVAQRAIARLPRERRQHAQSLRRVTRALDRAEDEMVAGSILRASAIALVAVLHSPRLFASPLIGPWTVRRLGGRLARRLRPA